MCVCVCGVCVCVCVLGKSRVRRPSIAASVTPSGLTDWPVNLDVQQSLSLMLPYPLVYQTTPDVPSFTSVPSQVPGVQMENSSVESRRLWSSARAQVQHREMVSGAYRCAATARPDHDLRVPAHMVCARLWVGQHRARIKA